VRSTASCELRTSVYRLLVNLTRGTSTGAYLWTEVRRGVHRSPPVCSVCLVTFSFSRTVVCSAHTAVAPHRLGSVLAFPKTVVEPGRSSKKWSSATIFLTPTLGILRPSSTHLATSSCATTDRNRMA
jgi:hypothetical protein